MLSGQAETNKEKSRAFFGLCSFVIRDGGARFQVEHSDRKSDQRTCIKGIKDLAM
jgi:hypothetical protein